MSHSPIVVSSPALPPFDEYVDEIRSIWDTHILTHQGPKYQQLESEIARYLDVDHAPLFVNGHLALQTGLWTLGDDKGEVITTPFTFSSTTQAIVGCGFTPVFCDIDPVSWCLDPNKIESLITSKTKAIVGVHVYGVPCDIDAIQSIAKKYGLAVIYDGAHAFGESINGKGIGSFGDMTMFSLHATKVFNSGEGGCLTFGKNEELYNEVCSLRQYGAYHTDKVEYMGTNAKLTELHAAMGICNLRHVDEYIDARKAVFLVYENMFDGVNGLQRLSYPSNLTPNYAYYPIVIDEKKFGASRDDIVAILQSINVIARKYFWPLTSSFDYYKGRFDIQETPIAKDVSERVLCLPLHPNLSIDEARRIAMAVLGARG